MPEFANSNLRVANLVLRTVDDELRINKYYFILPVDRDGYLERTFYEKGITQTLCEIRSSSIPLVDPSFKKLTDFTPETSTLTCNNSLWTPTRDEEEAMLRLFRKHLH